MSCLSSPIPVAALLRPSPRLARLRCGPPDVYSLFGSAQQCRFARLNLGATRHGAGQGLREVVDDGANPGQDTVAGREDEMYDHLLRHPFRQNRHQTTRPETAFNDVVRQHRNADPVDGRLFDDAKIAAADDRHVRNVAAGSVPMKQGPTICRMLLVQRQGRHLAKRVDGHRRQPLQKVGARREIAARGTELAHDQLVVRIELVPRPQRDVEALFDQIDPAIRCGDQQTDTGMEAMEGRDDMGDHRREADRAGNAHQTRRFAFCRSDHGFGSFDAGQYCFAALVEGLADVGHPQLSRRALEKPDIELLFQPRDVFAELGFRNVENARRS